MSGIMMNWHEKVKDKTKITSSWSKFFLHHEIMFQQAVIEYSLELSPYLFLLCRVASQGCYVPEIRNPQIEAEKSPNYPQILI